MTKNDIYRLRMARQGFSERLDRDDYQTLFRMMSPVMPLYWTMPGHPPVIQHRADFSDFRYNDLLRSRRQIVKARFQGGSVAYVFMEELALFAALYRKPIKRMSPTMIKLLDLIEHEGPINVRGMKESLSMYVKDITPALQALQKAFLVYEDQRSSDWDRGFYHFEREFPDLRIDDIQPMDALKTILLRFASLMGWFTIDEAISCYQLASKEMIEAIQSLIEEEKLKKVMLDGLNGYSLYHEDYLLEQPIQSGFFFLNRNDFYVRSVQKELSLRFPKTTLEPLYYLLHEGEFKGAVYGHFRIRPDEVEDVVFDRDQERMIANETAIIKALSYVVDFEKSPLQRFNGRKLT